MADDYSIRARITGDASEFKVAMEGAAASAESGVARIKQALAEAQAQSTVLAQSAKNDRDIIAAFGEPTAGSGGADFLPGLKERLAETEKQLEAARTKAAALKLELASVPTAVAAGGAPPSGPSGPGGLNESQLKLLATAAESAARQLKSLPAIQEEVAARVNASVTEMATIRRRADAEAAESAKFLRAIQVSGAVETGDVRGQNALTAATNQHTQALQVQQEVIAKQAAVTAEAEAREELLARATAQSTNATLADAQAQVQAAVAKEGSAVAALAVSDAQEATRAGAQKQAAAIAQANEVIRQSEANVAQIQAEVANQTGISTEKMGTYVKRMATEFEQANNAIKASQLALQEAITSGDEAAIASMAGLQEAAAGAAAGLADLKSQQADIAATQEAAAEAAAEQASALDVVTQVTTAAAERGQNFASIQQEIAASVGKTAAELSGTYARAAGAASVATAALVRDSERLGPAIQAGIPGATAAITTLRNQEQQFRSAEQELAATIRLKQLAVEGSTTATRDAAIAAAELAIQEKGSAVGALEDAVAQQKQALALEQVAGSSNDARVGLSLLEGSTQGMIFALSRVLAAIPLVKTALQYAFPVITAVAFITILDQMVKKLGEVTAEFYGFTKESQKRLEDVNRAIHDSFNAYLSLADKISEGHSIGLTGIPKIGIEALEAQKKLQNLVDEHGRLEDKAKKLQATLNEFNISKQIQQHPLIPAPLVAGGIKASSAFGIQASEEGTLEEVDAKRTQVNKDRLANEAEQDKLRAEITNKGYDLQEANFHKEIQLSEQRITKVKEYGLAEAAELKKRAEAEYAEGHIDADQKAALLATAVEQQYKFNSDYAAAHDALQARLAAKGEIPAYINEQIDQQRRAEDRLRELDEVDKTRAKNHNTDLEKINEEHLKAITDKLPEVKEAAPEGHGAQAELAFEQNQQTEIQAHVNLHPEDLEDYKKALDFLAKSIPRVMGEAAKETEKSVKESVDEQYRAWERGGERTAVQIIQFWSAVRTLYAGNAEVAKEADEKITEADKKYLENIRKVNEELQKQEEIRREGVLNAKKADITRTYITTPQTSLNPFAATPEQKEKQEIGQIDLAAIRSKQEQVDAELAIAKRGTDAENLEYQKLVADKLKLDNEYASKSAALQNEELKDEIQAYLNYFNQIQSAFFKGINEWILGQKSFSRAIFDSWRDIVTSVVQDIEKIGEKWIAEHLIMAAAAKLLHSSEKAAYAEWYSHKQNVNEPGAPKPPTLFGNGGLLGTGQVPLAGSAPVPVTVVGGAGGLGIGGAAHAAPAATLPGAIGGSGAGAAQNDVAAQQDAANKENAIWQQQIQKYLGFKQQQTTADQTATTQKIALTETGATATTAADAQTAATSITTSAGVGAAKAFTALANIPIVGPALGAAAAAAALALIESFAHFETGGYTPKGGLAVLHPGEVVVNHPVTSLLSNIAQRGGVQGDSGGNNGGSSGGKTEVHQHLHMHNNVQAFDSHGMDRVLGTHGKTMVRYFKAEMRNGRA